MSDIVCVDCNNLKKRLLKVSESKFVKFLKLIEKKISRDRNIVRRTNRLWRELISKRGYFNLKPLTREVAEKIEKSDLINFFERIFANKLSKLSIQEYSNKVEKLSSIVGSVRGVQGKLIKNKNYFRDRNRFI